MAFCSKCGAQVADQAAFCPQCGQAQGVTPPSATGTQSGLSENVASLLCYVAFWITGLIFLLIDKRPNVRFHAAQSLVVFGGLHIARILVGGFFGLGWVFGHRMRWSGMGLGFGLISLIELVTIVLWIVLMIKGYQGERYKVPLAGDLAESIAGK